MTSSSTERRERAIDPFAVSAAAMGGAFLLAGVVWPHFSGSFLRGYLVTLALLFVWGRVLRSGVPSEHRLDRWSPFDGFTDPRRSVVPEGLRDLQDALRAADDPIRAERALAPDAVRQIARSEAERLLQERHGLRLDDDAHRAAIRTHLTPRTWALIDPDRRMDDPREVPVAHLESILDDLETL